VHRLLEVHVDAKAVSVRSSVVEVPCLPAFRELQKEVEGALFVEKPQCLCQWEDIGFDHVPGAY